MKRTRNRHSNEVTAILCSDIHLREDQPICRTDNFWETQWIKVDFLYQLQKEYNCPVLHAGDLFHHWKPSPNLISTAIDYLPNIFYTIAGQHDIPYHNAELLFKAGIFTLWRADKIRILWNQGHWGKEPEQKFDKFFDDPGPFILGGRRIAIWHIPVYHQINPYHSNKISTAEQLLKKYPQFNLIVTGDNHIPFVVEHEDRLLVNPGSFTRQNVNETHSPRVYLYYAENNSIEPVELPHEKDVISREHLAKIEQRDERIDAFISKLSDDYDATLSFEENMNRFISENNMRESVVQLIYKSMNL
jgi:DNA repair exonuclease SbcCD nuclease subunit